MYILRETDDELVVFAPARAARIVASILLVAGLFLCLPIGLPMLWGGVKSLSGPPADPVWGVPAPLILMIPGALLCLPVVGGLIGLIRARDTEYCFMASERALIVRDRHRERRHVPFSEIREAVMYTSSAHDEPDTYGLRLELQGFLRHLQMSMVSRSGDEACRQMTAIADRINHFLQAHADDGDETTAKDELRKTAEQQATVVSSKDTRNKLCPRCGKSLSIYAVSCRFCKADVQ
jgi:hypothetical protein